MRTAEEMTEYALLHQFAFNGEPSLRKFYPLEKNLLAGEKVFITWTAGTVFANIYSSECVFEGETAFAFTNKRIIATDGRKTVSYPLEEFNGVYVTVNDTDFGDEIILVGKNQLMVFVADEILSSRLVRTINGYHGMLIPEIASEFDGIKCSGRPQIIIS